MANQPLIVNQDIFRQAYPPIRVVSVDENTLVGSPQILRNFLSTANDGFIGMAPVYGTKCALTALAFSTLNDVLLVRLSSTKPKGKKKPKNNARTPGLTPGQTLLRDNILCHPGRDKAAFRMDRLSASLFLDQNVRITRGVDLLSSSNSGRRSLDAIMNALGGETTLYKKHMVTLFAHEEGSTTPPRDVALQAWAACRVASLPSLVKTLSEIPRIDTQAFGAQVRTSFSYSLPLFLMYVLKQLLALAKTLRDADRLDALKPTKVKNDVTGEFSFKKGKLNVCSSRFKTRVMKSPTQVRSISQTYPPFSLIRLYSDRGLK
jgi:regulator of nonsense transcripts 1